MYVRVNWRTVVWVLVAVGIMALSATLFASADTIGPTK